MVLRHVRNLGERDRHLRRVVFPHEYKLVGLFVHGLDQEEGFGRTMLPMQSPGAFLIEAVNGLERNWFHWAVLALGLFSATRIVGFALIQFTGCRGLRYA